MQPCGGPQQDRWRRTDALQPACAPPPAQGLAVPFSFPDPTHSLDTQRCWGQDTWLLWVEGNRAAQATLSYQATFPGGRILGVLISSKMRGAPG